MRRAARGTLPAGWAGQPLAEAFAISGDGTTIVGYGFDPSGNQDATVVAPVVLAVPPAKPTNVERSQIYTCDGSKVSIPFLTSAINWSATAPSIRRWS